ncbi:MAG: hypothetical protein EBY61_07220, partial [Actinobacteria bacterium]|nr:hypothetical protein [Actinomycetota bacterium]
MAGHVLDDPELNDRLHALAATPHLLIASDYDGTIAPIVDDPMTALPLRETSVALRGLAALAQTGKFHLRVGAYPDPHPEAQTLQDCVDFLKRKIDAG